MGAGHRSMAAAAWLASSTALSLPGWQVAAGAVPAVAFSAGVASPDVDNHPVWKRLDRWLPDELLGDGGPLGHRELMHFWGLPALVAWFLWTAGGPWYAWAAVIGWSSHLVADFLCGQAGFGTQQGIPFGPWHLHAGVGFKAGGLVERLLAPVALAVAVWFAVGLPLPAGWGVSGVPVGDWSAWVTALPL